MLDSIVAASKSRTLRTLALILFGCLAPLRLFRANTPLLDADLWWHWRVGQWIWNARGFPHYGLFSQYGETHSWMAYSWGFEVILARLFAHFGLLGIPIFFMVVEVGLALLIFHFLRALSGSFWVALGLGVAAMWAMIPTLVGRPVMFSIVLYAVELGILFRARQTGRWVLLYWLPPLFLLWANLHIQFVYGLFSLALVALVETAVSRERWRRWSGVLGLSALATLVNPYTIGLYRVVWTYAHSKTSFTYISEMHANSFRLSSHYVELLLALGAFFFLGRCRKLDGAQLALLLAAAVIAFRSARDAWFLVLPAALAIAAAFRALPEEDQDVARLEERLGIPAWAAVLVGIAGLLTLHGLDSGYSRASAMKTIESVYPMRAVRFLRQRHLPGPLYNSFNEGGFLIGNLADYPVSIDGRADLYPDAYLEEYLSVAAAGANWQQDPVLEQANLVMLEPYLQLARELQHDSRYQLIYADDQATVFVRKR